MENALIIAVPRAGSTHTEIHSAYDSDLNALTSGAHHGVLRHGQGGNETHLLEDHSDTRCPRAVRANGGVAAGRAAAA